jgi:hypothetical protein
MRGGQTPLRQASSFNAAAAQGNAIKESLTEYNEFDKKLGDVVEVFQEKWGSSIKTGTNEQLKALLNKYKSNLLTVILGQTPEEHIAAILAADKQIAIKIEKEICGTRRPSNSNTDI